MDHGRNDNKRRAPRNEPEPSVKESIPAAQSVNAPPEETDVDDKPIPDDLSEISDDPDDILEREDVSCVDFMKWLMIICKSNR